MSHRKLSFGYQSTQSALSLCHARTFIPDMHIHNNAPPLGSRQIKPRVSDGALHPDYSTKTRIDCVPASKNVISCGFNGIMRVVCGYLVNCLVGDDVCHARSRPNFDSRVLAAALQPLDDVLSHFAEIAH